MATCYQEPDQSFDQYLQVLKLTIDCNFQAIEACNHFVWDAFINTLFPIIRIQLLENKTPI